MRGAGENFKSTKHSIMKKIIALFGAALLISGCFLPIMNVADTTFNFLDSVPPGIPNVPQNAMIYVAVVIIAIAILSAILALMNHTKLLWLAGIVTSVILVCVYFGFHSKMDEMKEDAGKQMDVFLGGMFKEMTDTLFQSVQLGGAGWYVIGTGALMLIISSIIKGKRDEVAQ